MTDSTELLLREKTMTGQHIIFTLDSEGNLEWAKLTDAGLASDDYAKGGEWTDWEPVISIPDTDSLVCRELGIAP